ncbi:MAG: hypothetical protein COT14_00500 [Candidatus Diapherotrites archaeon CG08_land_8_20_14_0_20_30_16]|nr:MAG: hypothetical protein COT14_00500 [Candidatus Diapherotrites archaeon CG08_land_8_20_14_0_20_30_16]
MQKRTINFLFNNSYLSVLKIFFDKSKDLSYKEIQKQTKQSKVTLLTVLESLCNCNLISKEKKGNAYFYSVIESEAYFLLKKAYFIFLFATLLKDLKTKELEIYLFGSYAKGTSDKHSDIDLFIVTKNRNLIWGVESKFKMLNLPLNIICKTPLEYASMIKKNPAFYKELEKNKVRLL